MSEVVRYEIVEDWIALVTIDRPEKRNAVNVEVAQGMAAAVTRSEADDKVRVVVLCSSGGEVFCAGADLNAVSEGRGQELYVDGFGFGGFGNNGGVRNPQDIFEEFFGTKNIFDLFG